MKIAYCLPDQGWVDALRCDNPRDAAHIQQKYIAEGLLARGHAVTWLAPQNLDHVYVNDRTETTLAPRTWTSSLWFGLLSRGIWKVQQLLGIPYLNFFSNLRRYDAFLQVLPGHDMVFERNSLYDSGAAMACKRLNLPYVMFFDADQIAELDFMGKPLKGLLRWRAIQLLRYNLNAANCIVCVTHVSRRHLIMKWHLPADKVVVFPNSVNVDKFRPDLEARTQIRRSFGMNDEPLVIFVGNFYHWHDVTTLVWAFADALKKYPQARLVLVGDGERRTETMQLATTLGLDRAVIFTGIVSHADVPRFIAAADIAVVPYPRMQQEMWLSPLKLFEYMSCGIAGIASAVGQVVDVVEDGGNGLLIPPGDPIALSDALIRLIEDPALRSKLGGRAREDAVRQFSWESYLSRLEALFVKIIQRSRYRATHAP